MLSSRPIVISIMLRFHTSWSSSACISTKKYINFYTFYDKILMYLNWCMFDMRLIGVRKLPEDDIGKIETCTSFEGLCV
jgi:hypothetical protein